MNKQKIGRILAIVVVTIVSATVFNFIAGYIFRIASTISAAGCTPDPFYGGCHGPNVKDATNAVTFLGRPHFGFWLTYTCPDVAGAVP